MLQLIDGLSHRVIDETLVFAHRPFKLEFVNRYSNKGKSLMRRVGIRDDLRVSCLSGFVAVDHGNGNLDGDIARKLRSSPPLAGEVRITS